MVKNKKKSILILGASSDIGISLVNLFLEKNWIVYAHYYKTVDKLLQIKTSTINLNLIKFNFNKEIKFFKQEYKKKFNFKVDAYVNLIGYIDNKSFNSSSYESIITSLKINSIYPYLVYKKIVPNMLKNKFGRILNCSSIGIKYGGGKNTFNYSLSKHFLEFIPSNFKLWSTKNLLINNLRIGLTDTKIHSKIINKDLKKRIKLVPIQRMANVEEISKYIYYLSSENNTYITGETLSISGGE